MKKKLFGFMLVFSIISSIVTMLSMTANAATSGTCGENLTWTLDDEGLLTISGTGEMDDYDYNNYPWSPLKDDITEIIISDGITTIGEGAFYHYQNVVNITLPDSITYIGSNAFSVCRALEDIVIPSSVTSIEDGTFYLCDNLKKITIPKSIIFIGESAISYCFSLKSIYYTGTIEDFEKITLGISNLSLTADKIIYNYNPNSININIENATSTDTSLKFISQVAIGENVDTEISAFGTVFVPLWLFNSNNTETAMVEYDNSKYNISNGQTYGATITNIPEDCKDMHIVGKSYIRDSNGNYIWSSAKYASVNDTTLKIAE